MLLFINIVKGIDTVIRSGKVIGDNVNIRFNDNIVSKYFFICKFTKRNLHCFSFILIVKKVNI